MALRSGLAACALGAAALASASELAICPGEGARYEDFKCNHDPTHRVCAQLLDNNGAPLNWGKGNFWQITGQEAFQWDDEIRKNDGDSWCICMWATAELIEAAGCENVHIDCAATDVTYVESKYTDGGTDLSAAKRCLQQKCGSGDAGALQQASDAALPALAQTVGNSEAQLRGPGGASGTLSPGSLSGLALAASAVVAVSFAGLAVVRRGRRTTAGGEEDQQQRQQQLEKTVLE